MVSVLQSFTLTDDTFGYTPYCTGNFLHWVCEYVLKCTSNTNKNIQCELSSKSFKLFKKENVNSPV